MQFLALPMLLGATAITIPIALHFFYRARYKPLPWGPMKFLKEAIEQTSRRLKFQEWVLLLLRCLAIVLLALAIARPAQEESSAGGGSGAIDAVLVFDTSYSMAARDGDKTSLERAKEAAAAVIDSLPDKSSIQIYSCSDRAQLLGPVSRYNRDQAKQLVQGIELTSLSSDFLPGLTEALAAARTGSAPAKEVYVFTDLQKSGFERQPSGLRAKCDELRADKAGLVFVRCGNPSRKLSNVAVTDLRIADAIPIPLTGKGMRFVVTLKNTGTEPIGGLTVRLELDGRALDTDVRVVEQPIEPGATTEVPLTARLDQPGVRLLTAAVTGDAVPGDNTLTKALYVRERVRALLVADPLFPGKVRDSADWQVRTALVPFDPDKPEEKKAFEAHFVQTESTVPAETGPDAVAGKDVVYLLNAPARTDANPTASLPPALVRRLGEFVRGGGGLVIGSGPGVDPEAYAAAFKDAELLPFPLRTGAGAHHNATDADPFRPDPESIPDGSALAPLKRKPYSDELRKATCTKMLALDETAGGGGRVLLRTSGGLPLAVSKTVGEGEVIFFTTALHDAWGSRLLAEGQLAIPLTTYVNAHLIGRKVIGSVRAAGDTLTWTPGRAAEGYELLKPRPRTPDAPAERPRVKVEARTDAPRPSVSTADTAVAGEYALVPAGGKEDDGAVFAVNPDLRETEGLAPASEADLEKLLGFRPSVIQAGVGTETAVRERRTRGEWTEWVLLALLVLLVGEATWAWMCGRAR